MTFHAKRLLISTAMLAAIPAVAHASAAVYVGYADGLRGGTDYPNPFAVGETFTAGGSTYTIADYFGNPPSDGLDAGAIMLLNNGSSAFTINDLSVTGNATFKIWSGLLGSGVTLAPGTGAIFTSTGNYNFDSSDYSSAAFTGASQTGTTFDPSTNNCSTGPIASSAACTSQVYTVTFTLNGTGSPLVDSGHVLDTGGYDSACCNHVHTGGGGVPQYNTNESLNWRLIGTSGINNPGGGGAVPEPATWAMMLLGFGAAGCAVRRTKRRSEVAQLA